MSDTTNLFAQQAANRRRSVWLVLAFIAFFAWLGFGGDWLAIEATRGAPPGHFHHKVLWSTGAREITAPANQAEQQLVDVVQAMAIAAGPPTPPVYIVAAADPN